MAVNSSTGKSEVVVEEGVSAEGTPTRTIRIVGDITKQNRAELARVLSLPMAAVHPAIKASGAANKPTVAPSAAAVPVVVPNAPVAAVPSVPAVAEKKGFFKKAYDVLLGMPTRDTRSNILNNMATGGLSMAKTPFVWGKNAIAWGATKTWNGAKQVAGWPLGKGANYNPITWPMKTLKVMGENKLPSTYGAAFGAAISSGLIATAPLAIPAIALAGAATFALANKYNKTETSEKAS